MASPTQWTWVWVNSGSWWWTGRPGILWSIGSQKVGHNWATELNWAESPYSIHDVLYMCVHVNSLQSCPTLCDPMDHSRPWDSPLSMGFSRQDYWSGLLCPLPGIFPNQGSNQHLLHLLPWQAPLGKPHDVLCSAKFAPIEILQNT